jgi:hypothetical protein
MTFAPENIHPDSWPQIYAIIAPALARAGTSASDLIDELLANTAQLWVKRGGSDQVLAAAITELLSSPDGVFVHGRILAGKASDIDQAIAVVTHHARMIGAKGIRIEGRNGWERILSAKGWTRRAVVMEKSIG